MGLAKQLMMEEQDRGWSHIEQKYACANCFDDIDHYCPVKSS